MYSVLLNYIFFSINNKKIADYGEHFVFLRVYPNAK